ncbi:MurR/RpiR family transcriptional regulator [Niallia sp. Sow4_A1]|uniref:MurR/RpiR family transcriptional regulator n=1 Tax=Niallia hominis TaxID=3133173 RepID=A0ABV1F5E4_9BACI
MFKWNTKSMSPSQYKIADYLQKNTHQVLLLTEQEIAEAVNVSIASVSRFWRIVGFKNLKEFKGEIAAQLKPSPAKKIAKLINTVDKQAFPYHTLNASIQHLYKTIEQFREDTFKNAVHSIISARKVYLYCPGPSLGLGELLKYRIVRYGLNFSILHKGGSELLEDFTHFSKEDVIIIFGFIRLLPEAQALMDYRKQIGYKIIIITDQLISEFTTQADIVLFASRGDIREFHSMIGPTYLIENLVLAVGAENEAANLQRLEKISELRTQYDYLLPR